MAALPSGTETIILVITGSKEEGSRNIFLHSVLQNEDRCWTEFCKYIKRRKGNRENIPAIKDHNGKLIKDPLEKAKFLNSD